MSEKKPVRHTNDHADQGNVVASRGVTGSKGWRCKSMDLRRREQIGVNADRRRFLDDVCDSCRESDSSHSQYFLNHVTSLEQKWMAFVRWPDSLNT